MTMGERNRFAFDRDYYNRIAAEMINGSTAKKRATLSDDESDIEQYLTNVYAPEFSRSNTAPARETRKSYAPARETRKSYAPARETGKSYTPARETGKSYASAPARETRSHENLAQEPGNTPEIKTKYLIRFNVVKFLLVVLLVGSVVQFALNLLSVKSNVNCIDKEIASAKIELEDVNSYNESLLGQLDISYDRNYIYNVAVGKLGMVYPKDNAVVYYKAADTSHVIQYREIS